MGPVRGCPGVVGRNRRDRPRPARAEPFEEADGILGVRLRLGAVGHVVVSLSASRPEREASRIWRIVQRHGLCAGGPGGYMHPGVNQLWRQLLATASSSPCNSPGWDLLCGRGNLSFQKRIE